VRTVHFRAFAAEHLDRFEPGRFDRMVLEEPYTSVLRTHWPGRAISAERDGRILGFAGAVIIDRCAHPWMVLSDEMRRDFPVLLTRLARRILNELSETDGVREISVTAYAGFDESCRWIERFGFSQTGFQDNMVRYSRMSGTEIFLAAGTALSMASQVQQVRGQSKLARYEANVAQQQAMYQRRLAEAQSARVRSDGERLLGRQIAALAAAGLDPASDSALLAQQSLASEAELEALEIRNGGLVRAHALDRSAELTLQRSRLAADRTYAEIGTRLLNGAALAGRQR
jgi:hypothetical protein